MQRVERHVAYHIKDNIMLVIDFTMLVNLGLLSDEQIQALEDAVNK